MIICLRRIYSISSLFYNRHNDLIIVQTLNKQGLATNFMANEKSKPKEWTVEWFEAEIKRLLKLVKNPDDKASLSRTARLIEQIKNKQERQERLREFIKKFYKEV